ncbi:histone-lysine N-methyltransferase ASHH1 isoform X1 [Prosopis cineraria]|uniref:histone-lysine N-methyltransferase ASHH1 isoform X1 n=2 Tax=Prosopis cineraria TaxID=364024 RepID=UPI0024101B79|nr:histone-lysine N-methyltransferase ASHH1 isoform X1 [Prosopis cineraria]XP_054787072.1 histone-lysine N-methyltransferase ASHH1 isoform X1 [Prosopis cineraria]XP_054787073.1 histone-lysine N-methyltransferase ASHH1 isoform X1 [Prosopis cineraria]
MDPHEELPQYIHITQNEFLNRRHVKQKEEDMAICECKYNASDPDSACGDGCLNVLTSSECTPGYCPCGVFCKNQRFQKCEYAKTKLFKTEGRGWGLLADENIKAGQFIIEYCGEVISWKEAKRRSQAYEIQGLKDAFIICLNASESIDATRKGSLGRFINHSCQPNCETRKWNVLGEIRVGIFAKQDIPVGAELAYDYNFEWFGGAKVRCLCGAAKCSGFLGAKSRGFQEDTYLWEDDDERYTVEKIPVYDSAEDEPPLKVLRNLNPDVPGMQVNGKTEHSMDVIIKAEQLSGSTAFGIQPHGSVSTMGLHVNSIKSEIENDDMKLYSRDTQQAFPQNNAMISRIRSNTAGRNYHIGPRSMSAKRSKKYNGRFKNITQKQVDVKSAAESLASKEAQEEILKYEEMKNEATGALDTLYNEIRPAIEEHERDSQDSVSTSVAEKWIEACCLKMKAEFDLYSSIVKNFACAPAQASWPSKTFSS